MKQHLFLVAGAALLLSACGSQVPQGEQGASAPAPQPSDAATAVSTPATPRLTGKFAPQDECAKLPGWPEFQTALRSAIKSRDAKAVAALANPQIKLDFGGGAGRSSLIARLGGKEHLWLELDRLDGLGCAYDPASKTAALPWFSQQDLSAQDPFEVLLAAGPKVVLRETAAGQGRPIAELSWILVTPQDEPVAGSRFRKVTAVGHSQTGYVESSQLRSAVGYRLIASHSEQGWQIGAFVAGD